MSAALQEGARQTSATASATPRRPALEELEANAESGDAHDSENDGSASDRPRGPALEELEAAAQSDDACDSEDDGSNSDEESDTEVGGGGDAVGLKRPREEGQ